MAGSNGVLDNVVAIVGNSAATGEPPTGLVLDLAGAQQGWTVRNTVVLPAWNAVQPQLTVAASGGSVTGVSVGSERGLGFDPYGTQVPLAFSGNCTAAATANVNTDGSIGTITVTQGGVGCSGTTTASISAAGTWDTAAPVNLITGQNMAFFGGNLLKGNGGYTVWNAAGSQSYGTQLGGGGGTLPGGGTYKGLVANTAPGSASQVDQFPGVDFGSKLQACLGTLSASYGGTCDARNFTGSLSMGSDLTISTANATVLLPCATISTANQAIVTAGTRNVALRGCALRGASTASGSQGGTVFLYSGTGAMVQVGDPTYAADTMGFHMDNVAINTIAATSATAQGVAAYRTQELDLESLYLLGNSNQTGMTLDGTGNYTGGTFLDDEFNGFQTAVNAIGHQVANAATTDWMNASAFVRLHIDCPTSGGSPIAGTYGINLQQGDGNTFTGGDVEGCSTALHLGVNAQNNTIVGLRNENSANQVVADAGSSYNNWMTGGTMFTGQLTDNGTRNSFLDTFHRSFNGMNGDWYGSQQDATVTNHYRIGIGAGNERGLLDRYQTDYGYRWTTGLSDATAGEQFYQVLDELNNVYRLSIGQYNHGQSSTNNQTVINAAGTGAVVLNGSTNAGTGGVVIGSGGADESTVATINNTGNAQFNGTLQVGGTSTFINTPTVKNQVDAEIDETLWAGLTTSQKESYIYKDWNGNSQWYMVKDASNNWALNSALGGLDSFKAYQSNNSGDTYIDASNTSGVVRVNYESGSGAGFNIYGGGGGSLYASFTGTTSIKFPGLAASSGHNCLQIDNSGYISNTGSACGSGSGGGSGTVGSGNSGQIAYYAASGTVIGGMCAVPLTAGGTGASTASSALANLNGISTVVTSSQTMAGSLSLPSVLPSLSPYVDIRAYGAKCDNVTDDTAALQAAITALTTSGGVILIPGNPTACYFANPTTLNYGARNTILTLKVQGQMRTGSTFPKPQIVDIVGDSGSGAYQFQGAGQAGGLQGPTTWGTLGTTFAAGTQTFTPSTMTGIYPGAGLTVAGTTTCTFATATRASNIVTAQFSSSCHIPAGVNVTIAGGSDTSFDGTFAVAQSDYVLNTLAWPQTAANSTSTGGSATGMFEDTEETVLITATTSSTATATFSHAHNSADFWGIAGLYVSGASHGQIKDMAISSSGAALWLYDADFVTMENIGIYVPTSLPARGIEIDGSFWLWMKDVAITTTLKSWAIRLTNSTGTYQNNPGIIFIDDSTIMSGIKMDHGAGDITVRNTVFEQSTRGGVVLDSSVGVWSNLNAMTFYNVGEQDNFGGFQQCLVASLYGGGAYPEGTAMIVGNSAGCMANNYYQGHLTVQSSNGVVYGPTANAGPVGKFEDGKILEAELRGQQASMGPAVIPYATLNTTTNPSSWSGSCTVATGVLAPDGSTTAGGLTTSSSSGIIAPLVYGVTPAVGDHILYGGWVMTPSARAAAIAGATGTAFMLDNEGTSHFAFSAPGQSTSGQTSPADSGIVGDWWHPIVGVATIASADGTAGTIRLGLSCDSTKTMDYWMPFAIYVPASANVALKEIMRWRQQLLHGVVPPGMPAGGGMLAVNPAHKLYWGSDTNLYRGAAGVVQTDGAYNAANGYQVGGNPIKTGNLADWTNTGATNGYCAVWNSSTGKWTPGLCTASGGAVTGPSSSINGDLACWSGTSGTGLSDCGPQITSPKIVNSLVQTVSGASTNLAICSSCAPGTYRVSAAARVATAGTTGAMVGLCFSWTDDVSYSGNLCPVNNQSATTLGTKYQFTEVIDLGAGQTINTYNGTTNGAVVNVDWVVEKIR